MQKLLIFDIETSPNTSYTWEKYQQDVIAFEKEREIICFAYKWLGEKEVKVYSSGTTSHRKLITTLHSLFDEADIILAHNGDRFDIKMANTAFIESKLPPPSPYKTIDTLKIARNKFRFNSNKLNDLAIRLGVGEKVDTGGFKLWLKCLQGDKKSWRLMEKYNKMDVILLEKVYLKLRSWAKTPEIEHGMVCTTCGSKNIQFRGWNVNSVFRSKRYQCQDCGKWGMSNLKERHNQLEYIK